MRIAIDARMYGLENAGIGRYLINLISELQKIDKDNQYVIILRKKYFYELKLPRNWEKVLGDFKHYTVTEQLQLIRILRSIKADLVHFPHLNTPFFWNKRFIVTVHDLTMQRQGRDASKLGTLRYYLKRVPFLLISKHAVKTAVKIIVPSNYVKEDVSKYYSIVQRKVEVIYEGVENKKINKQLDALNTENSFFFYVGNSYPHKNLKKLIDAFCILKKDLGIKQKLLLVGSQDYFKDKLKDYVKTRGLQKQIVFKGFMKDDDIYSLYAKANGFLYPSLAEGFGLQGLEAMQNGTLLLASDIPVFKEIYKENAIYFDPKNPYSIANSIKKVLEMDQKEKDKRIKDAKKFVKNYTWSKMATETLEIYNSIK